MNNLADRKKSRGYRRLDLAFQFVFLDSPIPMCVYDRETLQLLEVNTAMSRLLGRDRQDLMWLGLLDVTPEDCQAELREHLQSLGAVGRHEAQILVAGGHPRWLEIARHNFDLEGQAVGLAMLQDIHDRKMAEKKLQSLAFYDPLTGLANREKLRVDLEQAVSRGENHPFTLLFADLDRLKAVNDTLGHLVGDRLLQAVSGRLKSLAGPADTVARIGGDEFVLLLQGVQPADLDRVLAGVLDSFGSPFSVEDERFYLTCSVGAACWPEDGQTPEQLLQRAGMAMYAAKQGGRNRAGRFDPALEHAVHDRLKRATALRDALANNEFVLHYQPQVRIQTGEVCGFEALLRWRQPDGSLRMPGSFVDILEEHGLIQAVGAWAIHQACQDLAIWRRAWPDLTMSVNLSALQLQQASLPQQVQHSLQAAGLPVSALELEITETSLLRGDAQTRKTLESLNGLQITLALDDFGTGFSALQHLKQYPISVIKIDRDFVDGITQPDSPDRMIVRGLIDLARNMTLDVVAEGIETTGQWDTLKAWDCQRGQGFLFSAGIPAGEVPGWIDTWGRRPKA